MACGSRGAHGSPTMKTSRHPAFDETCDRAAPKSDVEHFVVCPECGQIFDSRDEAQVRHHTEALHEPLLTGAAALT